MIITMHDLSPWLIKKSPDPGGARKRIGDRCQAGGMMLELSKDQGCHVMLGRCHHLAYMIVLALDL